MGIRRIVIPNQRCITIVLIVLRDLDFVALEKMLTKYEIEALPCKHTGQCILRLLHLDIICLLYGLFVICRIIHGTGAKISRNISGWKSLNIKAETDTACVFFVTEAGYGLVPVLQTTKKVG